MEFSTFLPFMIVALVVSNMTSHFLLQRGDTYSVYRINIISFTLYIVIETWLAIRDPSQWSVILFNVSNVWALSMAIKGFLRTRHKRSPLTSRVTTTSEAPLFV
jgi:hypothetical protein